MVLVQRLMRLKVGPFRAGVWLQGAALLMTHGQLQAAIINAATPALADVQLACNSAANRDMVMVPPGTATWTATLNISKGITLIGAGSDQTRIIDEVPRVLLIPAVINVTLNTNQVFRLTGFTFQGGAINTAVNYDGVVRFYGSCFSNRVDHCHFDGLYGDALKFYGMNLGVVDHCRFDGARQFIIVWHDGWGGNSYGDGSWAAPSNFGGWQFLFIEDNIFNFTDPVTWGNYGVLDCMGGGREVIRFNSFTNCHPTTHGTESTGRQRSVRVAEIYNNTLVSTVGGPMGQYRGGTGVVFSNILTGFDSGMELTCYREIYGFTYWGGCNGTNAWDSNEPTLYASGTHTGTNGATALANSGAGWTVNQWVGYILQNATKNMASFITANHSTTVAYNLSGSTIDGGPTMTFDSGDTFFIRKALIALDQPGRGQGNLLSGADPVPVAWPNQALEPIYCWGNTLNGVDVGIGSSYPTIQENRDFFNKTVKPGYVPYRHPHPLVAPPPPTNLRIVGP